MRRSRAQRSSNLRYDQGQPRSCLHHLPDLLQDSAHSLVARLNPWVSPLIDQRSLGSRDQFSITDVEDLTGLSARTVRFYITEGLIPPAHGRGPSASYDRDQVMRLMLVQQLKLERLPLDQIKGKLNALSDRQVSTILNAGS